MTGLELLLVAIAITLVVAFIVKKLNNNNTNTLSDRLDAFSASLMR